MVKCLLSWNPRSSTTNVTHQPRYRNHQQHLVEAIEAAVNKANETIDAEKVKSVFTGGEYT